MVRVAGVNIPDNKRIEIALTYIYGIGRSLSQEILADAGISFDIRAKDLKETEIRKIQEIIAKKNLKIEEDLKRKIRADIKHLKDISCYRGIRHLKKLPVRGQRTRRNTRTIRGNVRLTMSSGKRKLEKK
ncbi:30S ribosomal protein S13 [bacterium]|nr:30S ribosomal protein S13 [bacterium]